jgi:3'-5' exoribonuclease
MKTRYVADLRSGEVLASEIFAVTSAIKAEDKNKQPYWDVTLADKTGNISGKIWADSANRISSSNLQAGKLVQLTARVEEYKGKLQLNISSVMPADETRMDDFVKSGRFDAEKMFEKLQAIVSENIEHSDLKALFENLFADSQIVSKLKTWPAGISLHHEFRAGLLQHVLEMLGMALGTREYYPELNYEIVIAGIIFHDLGKFVELDAAGVTPMYTLEGNLLGHIYLGVELLNKYYPQAGDPRIKLHLQHIILSHHGEKEKGSPVLPATGEALMVHKFDAASSEVRNMADVASVATTRPDSTEYNRYFQRTVWLDSSNLNSGTTVQQAQGNDSSSDEELVFSL